MQLRFKYLGFLALFLTGSFLIVTWKAYDIFSKKYAQAYQNMQIQDLEKQAVIVNSQFEVLQKVLQSQDKREPLLQSMGVSLLAHIIKEDGKWKAQWFEGIEGLRTQAKGVAQQIPFDSLSTSKKSWHFVNIKDHGQHIAYVIPVFEEGKMNYFSFFFKTDFFSKWFKGSLMSESLTLVSPQIGEIYSLGEKGVEGLDRHKDIISKKQTGLWPVSKNVALISYFHPDLQILFVKNISLQNLVIESSAYLWALFAIIGILVVMSLIVMDLVLRQLFQKAEQQAVSTPQEQPILVPSKVEPVSVTPAIEKPSPLEEVLRPKAINCLGYLNRFKTQFKEESPHLQMLEKELRELRGLIDPAESVVAAQPSFNPIHMEAISSELDVESLLKSIRKPKRESHESKNV
ncbi:hypothetical protein K2X05_12275 [bacterium]|nr:hypothetical protein [bacterium]